jgi:hypothetical protein
MQNKSGADIPRKNEQLVVGYEFPPTSYKLDMPLISKYLEAVGSRQQDPSASGFVPPTAIAAYAMTAMSHSLLLPSGTIHASQELESFKAVPIGSTISCRGRIARKIDRGELHLMLIELDALDLDGETVLSGRATLVLPS